MSNSAIKYENSNRYNQKIIKICDTCGLRYHPRKNGYEKTSRFCSQECAKTGRNKMGFN